MKLEIKNTKEEIVNKINVFLKNYNKSNIPKLFLEIKNIKVGNYGNNLTINDDDIPTVQYSNNLSIIIDIYRKYLEFDFNNNILRFDLEIDEEYYDFICEFGVCSKDGTAPFNMYDNFPKLINIIYKKFKEKLLKEIEVIKNDK